MRARKGSVSVIHHWPIVAEPDRPPGAFRSAEQPAIGAIDGTRRRFIGGPRPRGRTGRPAKDGILHTMDDSTQDDDVLAATSGPSTAGTQYAERLNRLQNKRWKKVLNVQAPYRANIRRMKLGRTIDVGCGNGRNLGALSADSVGVDHNPHLVEAARLRGLTAYTSEEFFADPALSAPASYDALLAAHFVEHLNYAEAVSILRQYLQLVRPGGRVVCITPQERGFASDPTHIEYADFAVLRRLSDDLGVRTVKQYSFPFPRALGKLFIYNEFNHIGVLPPAG